MTGRKTIFMTLMVCFALHAEAQTDLQSEILMVKDSTALYIRSSRELVMQRIGDKLYDDLLQIVDFATAKAKTLSQTNDTTNIMAFYPFEIQLLCLLNGNTSRFFRETMQYPQITNKYEQLPITNISYLALYQIIENKEHWKKWYSNLDVENEDKAVMRLFLGMIGLFNDDFENHELYRSYTKTHPNSQYANFVKFAKNKLNYTRLDFAVSGGVINLKGDITQLIAPRGIFAAEMLYRINRHVFGASLMGASSDSQNDLTITSKDEVTYNITKGERLSASYYQITYGWTVIHTRIFAVYPSVAVGSFSVSLPPLKDRNKESITFNNTLSLGGGINADISLYKVKSKQSMMQPRLLLRLSANYNSYISSSNKLGGRGFVALASLVMRIE